MPRLCHVWSLVACGMLLMQPDTVLSQNQDADRAANAISENAIRAHMETLSDDVMEGRGTGQRGSELAAEYISAQFHRLGLAPAGDSGSYFQRFSVVARQVESSLRFSVNGNSPPLKFGHDFIAWPLVGDSAVNIAAEAIFVGYGIVAPHHGRNDYAGINARGKVVIVLAGSPITVDSIGTYDSYYGERDYKEDEARRQGAVAMIMLMERPPSWELIATRLREGSVRRFPAEIRSSLAVIGQMWIQTAEPLLRHAGIDIRSADFPDFQAREMGRVALRAGGPVRLIEATNVVARLAGTNSSQDETVVVGGHYDHLGIGPAVEGDSIYNGALDNASGTGILLAIAEAFAGTGVRPARSIIFVAFGAEELGLYGSQTFVARLEDPLKVAAMLNLDGGNVRGRMKDASAVGLEHSTLAEPFRRAAHAEGVRVEVFTDEIRDRFLFRSDQLSFIRAGIPALYLRHGRDPVEQSPEWVAERWAEFRTNRYHQPADEMLSWYTMDGLAQQARIVTRFLLDVANSPNRPSWMPASEFKSLRESSPYD
jgi:hypothetical protein